MTNTEPIDTKTATRKINIMEAAGNLEQQVLGVCDEMGTAGYKLSASVVLERSTLVLIFQLTR